VPRSVRILLLALALGPLALVAAPRPAGAAGAQEFGTTTTAPVAFGQAEVSTTLAEGTATTESNQTVVDNQPIEGKPLWSESRKVAAIIGALVFVAFALTLLTIRYIRMTKPIPLAPAAPDAAVPAPEPAPEVAPEPAPVARDPDPVAPATEPVQTVAPTPASDDPVADHVEADAAWEPRGTGEHPAVAAVARPNAGARRAALERASDG
jgi:hypothetical protein